MLASNPSVPITVVAPVRTRRPSALRMAGRALLRDPFAIGASFVVALVIFCALLGPQVAPYDPTDQEIAYRLRPPMWQDRGTAAHPLGTDQLGRDILSRMIYGARVSVEVGLIVVFVGGTVGTLLGVSAGFFGGRLEAAVIGAVDVILSFPGLLLALIIAATFGATIPTMILALSLRGWVVYARITRGQTLSLNQYQFVEAARCIGAPSSRILAKHMLPNLLPSIVTIAVLELARVVLAESSLSFLGLGVQPPGVSWGLMLAEGRNYMLTANWLVTLPGLAIAATVLGVNILASHVRRFVDPFQRGRGDSIRG
jgi:peptide/nickel transport system permease protein